MEYELSIEPMGDYLYVQATGDLDYDIALDAWTRIVKACDKHQCFNVLGVQNMKNALTTMEAYDHQKVFREAGVTLKMRIAWVDINAQSFQMTRFAETVLLNRGLVNGRLFADVAEAKRWLLGDKMETMPDSQISPLAQ